MGFGYRIDAVPSRVIPRLPLYLRVVRFKAIPTVSPEQAQGVTAHPGTASIQGVWSFTGPQLAVPDSRMAQDRDSTLGMALCSAKLAVRRAEHVCDV